MQRFDDINGQPMGSHSTDLHACARELAHSHDGAAAGPVQLTVAICTHDRLVDVRDCLQSLWAQQPWGPADEILIIDSGSPAACAQGLRDLARQYPGCRVLRLEEPGLSKARNAALRAAHTRWLAYLDDDALVDADWLPALRSVLATVPSGTAIVGGRISPLYQDATAAGRITERWKLLLSCTEGTQEGRVDEGHPVCGANLVVDREAVLAAGCFLESLGRVGQTLISGEESELIERLTARGLACRYSPRFGVRHKIAAERTALPWVRRRAYWEGVSQARIGRASRPWATWLRLPKLLASTLACTLLAVGSPRNPDWQIRREMARGTLVGTLTGRR